MEDPEKEFHSLASLDFPNYAISRNGIIKNLSSGYLTTGSKNKVGRIRLRLINSSGKTIDIRLYNLLALMFIGPRPSPNHTVDHIDGDPTNNSLSNLRWATKGEQTKNRKNTKHRYGKPMTQMDLNGTEIMTWFKIKYIADEYKLNASILGCAAREGTIYGGFTWKYANNDIEGEIWIELNTDDYLPMKLSSKGRIIDPKGRISNGSTHKETGYKAVGIIMRNGIKKHKLLHRLIMLAFYPNDPRAHNKLYIVNHKDGNKLNNCIENLEYLTSQDNTIHAIKIGLVPSQINNARTSRQVEKYDLKGNFLALYQSQNEAKRDTKVNSADIGRVCKGTRKTAGGFIWKYKL